MCLKSGGPHPEAYQTFVQSSVEKRISDFLEVKKIMDTSPQQNNKKKVATLYPADFGNPCLGHIFGSSSTLGLAKIMAIQSLTLKSYQIKAKLKHVALDIQIAPEVCLRYILGGSKYPLSRCLDV